MERRFAAVAATTCAQAPGVAAFLRRFSPSVLPKGRLRKPLPPVLSHHSSCYVKKLLPLVFILLVVLLAPHSPLSWSANFPGLGSYPLCPPCSHPFYPTLHPPFSWPVAVMATSALRDRWPLEARRVAFPSKCPSYLQLSHSPSKEEAVSTQLRWRSHLKRNGQFSSRRGTPHRRRPSALRQPKLAK